MELICNGRNLCIVEKKAEEFQSIFLTEEQIHVKNYHVIKDEIHAILYAEELRNLTIIIKGKSVYKIALILGDAREYQVVFQAIRTYFPEIEYSVQNHKINSYSNALVEKLREGITLVIMDTKKSEDVIYCPECGMQCDPNIPYCMECGASI